MKKQPKVDMNVMFWQDLINEDKTMNVNGKLTSRGYWNLIISIRDCSLYSKGIKPNRFWKISNVKNYFGIKENAEQLRVQLEEIKTFIAV
jgi:hypothetical protein